MNSVSSAEELLVQLEKCLLQPNTRNSGEVAQLLADDFVEFGSSGQRFTKPEVIHALQVESPDRFEASGFRVRFLAQHVALVTYVALRSGSHHSSSSLRSSLWEQLDGRWQLVFHQGTPTEQRPCAC